MLESAGTGVVQSMLDQNILINVPYLLSEERLFLVIYTCKYYVNRWPWGNFPWYRGLRDPFCSKLCFKYYYNILLVISINKRVDSIKTLSKKYDVINKKYF